MDLAWDDGEDSDSTVDSEVTKMMKSEQVRLRLLTRYLSVTEKNKKGGRGGDYVEDGHDDQQRANVRDLEARVERLEKSGGSDSTDTTESVVDMDTFTTWMAEAQTQIDEWKDLLLKRETREATLLEKVGEILEEQGLRQQPRDNDSHVKSAVLKMAAAMEKKDKQIETLTGEVLSLRGKLEEVKEPPRVTDTKDKQIETLIGEVLALRGKLQEGKKEEAVEVVATPKPSAAPASTPTSVIVPSTSKSKRSNSAMYDLAAMDGVMWADDVEEGEGDEDVVNQNDVSLSDIISNLWK
ncbi:hypothetical protein TrLO_g4193 [Triparma laevis f. longispina]|uniref:Uncharacterized protein n=1 Tax=Triparma laevis f. longispina TaxID=1714387 RepID=A0A9W7FK16_9STRA|nr:hypothetical protein TrLO_g4193 [Triparma laevis f. longispina]